MADPTPRNDTDADPANDLDRDIPEERDVDADDPHKAEKLAQAGRDMDTDAGSD